MSEDAMIDVEEYKEQGFVLCRNLFAREEIVRIHEEAKEVFALQMIRHRIKETGEDGGFAAGMFKLFETDLAAFVNCGKQAQHLISLHRLSLDERITVRLKELGLKFPNISTRPVLYFNHPRLAKREVYWRLG